MTKQPAIDDLSNASAVAPRYATLAAMQAAPPSAVFAYADVDEVVTGAGCRVRFKFSPSATGATGEAAVGGRYGAPVFSTAPVKTCEFGAPTEATINAAEVWAWTHGPYDVQVAPLVHTIANPIVTAVGVRTYAPGATVNVGSGYPANYMVMMTMGSEWRFGKLNAAGMNSPSGPWLGVGVPVGTIFTADGTTNSCDNIAISNATAINAPSGAVFTRSCNNLTVNDNFFQNNQNFTAAITSAVVEAYNGNTIHVRNNEISGYRWKGINLGASTNGWANDNHIAGGTQDPGHAAFYEDGSTRITWSNNIHEGPGFALKAHASTQSTVINQRCIGSSGCVYAQAPKDFEMRGGFHDAPDSSNYSVIIEGISTQSGVTGGPIDGAIVQGFKARRQVQGTTTNHRCIAVKTDGVQPISGLKLLENECFNFYEGIGFDNVAGATSTATATDVTIKGNTLKNNGLYGILAYLHSGELSSNYITTNGGAAPGIVVSQIGGTAAGGDLRVLNNDIPAGPTAANVAPIQIGSGGIGGTGSQAKWTTVTVAGNKANGGTRFIDVYWGSAGDSIGKLDVLDNSQYLASPGLNAFNFTANNDAPTPSTTLLHFSGNSSRATDGTFGAVNFVSGYANFVAGSVFDLTNAVKHSIAYNRTCLMKPMGAYNPCTYATIPGGSTVASTGNVVGESAYVSDCADTAPAWNAIYSGGGATKCAVRWGTDAHWHYGG